MTADYQDRNVPCGSPNNNISKVGIRLIRLMPIAKKAAYMILNFPLKRMGIIFICNTIFGAKIVCNPRDFIQRMICNFGYWEPDITAAVSRMIQPGDVFVDVGANVGYYSLLAASKVGASGRVFAIEPHPVIFSMLLRNIQLNDFNMITPINKAAGSEEGEISFFSGPPSSLGVSSTVERRGLDAIGRVSIEPLTKIIPLDYLNKVALIKVDVEGAESEVLNDIISHIDLFSDNLKIIVELAEDNFDRLAIFSRMLSLGFHAYAVANNYDDIYYINWTRALIPTEVTEVPSCQVDLVFSKRALDFD